jgi:hypothetical protein
MAELRTTIHLAATKWRSFGGGMFQEPFSYLRPRGREYTRRSVGKDTNEVRHFSENRQTGLEGRNVTPHGWRCRRKGIPGLSGGFPG